MGRKKTCEERNVWILISILKIYTLVDWAMKIYKFPSVHHFSPGRFSRWRARGVETLDPTISSPSSFFSMQIARVHIGVDVIYCAPTKVQITSLKSDRELSQTISFDVTRMTQFPAASLNVGRKLACVLAFKKRKKNPLCYGRALFSRAFIKSFHPPETTKPPQPSLC